MSEPPDAPQPTIAAGSLVLRPWSAEDDVYLVKAFEDPDIRGWSGCRIGSPEDAEAWISRWNSKWESRSAASCSVFATDDTQAFIAFLRSLDGVHVEVTDRQIRVSQD